MGRTYDFAVIGAGVFGAWTAHYLQRSGAHVALIDAYGATNGRASSSGETRVIRAGYGPDELYTRWAVRSLPLWCEFFDRVRLRLFHRTGVLWLSTDGDTYTQQLLDVLSNNEVPFEKLSADDIRQRYPQFLFEDVAWGLLETRGGLLMARQAVQALVKDAVRNGVDYQIAFVSPPEGRGSLSQIKTSSGVISAATFVFACGPWLPKLFPELLAQRIFVSRQEVFFLGPPPGVTGYGSPQMPVWLHHGYPGIPYALPDMENRGLKIAFDQHGPAFDPDTGNRVVRDVAIDRLRSFLKKHLPAMHAAPILETRVCQYENTSNGDFLIDRHPDFENVWIVGGGSGHGFKHGPAVADYVSARILRHAPAEPRFSLATKQTVQMRAVY
ncbi:MAG TPA: FAD-dependent oxidoreductase [Candidatus Angelobacter sp.]|jgi:glycine/D-amino acid oxidase-like deaminating enzyme|nr:FAD-dependent oxidoreductase [Candidatus Angelobacter sp.]